MTDESFAMCGGQTTRQRLRSRRHDRRRRTERPLTLPGFLHDRCSSIFPLGITSPFFKVVRRAIERATPGSALLASIHVETDRVKAIIYDLGGNTYSIAEAMDRVDQIIEATRRLDKDIERLG